MTNFSDLRRSRTNKVFAGVAGGIADGMGWNATALRWLFVIFSFFSGFGLIAYIILWMIMPEEEEHNHDTSHAKQVSATESDDSKDNDHNEE